MKIAGRAFVVTGAGSGLGAASAALLLELGAHVVAVDRVEVQQLGASGRFIALAADVCNDADMQRAFAEALVAYGEVWGVVHCAGISHSERVMSSAGLHGLESFRTTLEVNLTGAFNVVRHGAQTMARNACAPASENGAIVLTGSITAFDGTGGQAAYAASKGGVVAMTLPLARDLARFGVRVNCIAPGIFETPMLAGLSEKARARFTEQTVFPQRPGRPREFAQLAVQLLENELINAATIRIDAGARLQL